MPLLLSEGVGCACCLQMLEEAQFSTPPSSPPPPSMFVPGYEKQHGFKVSSVSWCTDFMQVMGCEKNHNFKVSLPSSATSILYHSARGGSRTSCRRVGREQPPFFKVLVNAYPFVGPLISLFWTFVDVSSGFQSHNGQPYSHLAEAYVLMGAN